MLRTLWLQRSLLFELTKREFSGRYGGSISGIAWSFVQPIFLLSIYTVAFGVILKARWGFSGGTTDYAFLLFAALIVFGAFSDCLGKGPTLIKSHPNFIKKIVFPLEILPWVSVLSALCHAIIGCFIWMAGFMLVGHAPHLTWFFFPLILICFFPFLLGIGWLLSGLGVFLPALNQLPPLFSHVLLFLTPIFYSLDAAPPHLQPFLALNPLTFVIEQARLVLFFGTSPHLKGLLLYFVLSSLFALCSLIIFKRLRPSFADMV